MIVILQPQMEQGKSNVRTAKPRSRRFADLYNFKQENK